MKPIRLMRVKTGEWLIRVNGDGVVQTVDRSTAYNLVKILRRAYDAGCADTVAAMGRERADEVPKAVHEHGWQWRPVGDGAFAPPFGDIRVCRVCGCLVAGGPTACVRCVRAEEEQAEAEPFDADAFGRFKAAFDAWVDADTRGKGRILAYDAMLSARAALDKKGGE